LWMATMQFGMRVRSLVAVLALVVTEGLAEAPQPPHVHETELLATRSKVVEAISPELRPKSDKKFMRKDYPDDSRPEVTKYHKQYDFDHPYPIVQEDAKYDDDFVKDENNDGGEWKAQEDYDRLRIKIAKVKAELDKLKAKLREEEEELKDADEQEKDAEAASKKAEEESDALKKVADDAQDELDHLTGSAQGDAEAVVKDEMSDLAKCKEELAKAKAELEKLLKARKEADANLEAAKAKKDDTAAIARQTESLEDDLEKEVAEEKADFKHAEKQYKQQLQEVKETEAALEKAAAKLRKYRRNVDPEGGVYYVPGPDGGPTEKPARSGGVLSVSQSPSVVVVAFLISMTHATKMA